MTAPAVDRAAQADWSRASPLAREHALTGLGIAELGNTRLSLATFAKISDLNEVAQLAPGLQLDALPAKLDAAERALAADAVVEHDADGWPPPLDLRDLAQREPEPPAFVVQDWLPCGYVTLLAGHGGIGKSAIALHLAVCIALGLAFCGLAVERRRVLYLACEDRADVLHWRLARICRHLGVDMAALAGWLQVLDLVGRDSILWDRDPRTGYTFTMPYGNLEACVKASEAQVLFVDGIADTFGGNENSRTDVKRFINSLVELMPKTGATVLIGHVAKPASSAGPNGDGYSGSTGWHNSVRARWYLYPETVPGDDGERGRSGDLVLDLQKANLGRADGSIRWRWDEDGHIFIGRLATGLSEAERHLNDQLERDAIIAAMKACADRDIVIPAATQGPRTAFCTLALTDEFPASLRVGKPAKRRFFRHLEALRQSKQIKETEYRRTNRHVGSQLVLVSSANPQQDGMRQCATYADVK